MNDKNQYFFQISYFDRNPSGIVLQNCYNKNNDKILRVP